MHFIRTINEADVEFMSGMIPHHAQAVLIAGWAESHGARRDVLVLCQRIVVGQRDEIGLMQRWLRERGRERTEALLEADGGDAPTVLRVDVRRRTRAPGSSAMTR